MAAAWQDYDLATALADEFDIPVRSPTTPTSRVRGRRGQRLRSSS